MTKPPLPIQVVDPFAAAIDYRPNALIYGHSGTGKTGLASTAPRPLILDCENGATVTVRAVGNPDARVVQINSVKEIREVFAYLRNEEHDFETVVLDPLGDLQRMMMEEVLEKYPSRRQFNRVPSMQDWGLLTEDFRKLYNAFRDLPLYTIYVAHAQTRDKEEDVVSPMIQGKHMLSHSVRSVDLLGYMYVEMEEEGEPLRTLLTASTATISAKNRGSFLPQVMHNPNMTEIFEIMTSGEAVEGQATSADEGGSEQETEEAA